jgi:hypothetical protein
MASFDGRSPGSRVAASRRLPGFPSGLRRPARRSQLRGQLRICAFPERQARTVFPLSPSRRREGTVAAYLFAGPGPSQRDARRPMSHFRLRHPAFRIKVGESPVPDRGTRGNAVRAKAQCRGCPRNCKR